MPPSPSALPSGRRIAWGPVFALLLSGLLVFSLVLAWTRIYQVDEVQNVFTARIAAAHWQADHKLWIEIWHLWPLSWFAAWQPDAAGLFHASRLFMLGVFWLNLGLMALNTGVPLRSTRFLGVLLGAACLTPLWDYGFEIRHDNLLLLLLLAFLAALRSKGKNARPAAILLGVLAALMQLITFKAFVYWVPLAVLLLAIPPRVWNLSRRAVFVWAFLGFVGTAIAVLFLLKVTGRLPFFMDSLAVVLDLSVKPSVRVAPWATLIRWVRQAPLLLALTLGALIHGGQILRRPPGGVLPDAAALGDGLLVLTGLAALLVHPFPLPYHLCLVLPFAYSLSVRWLADSWDGFGGNVPPKLLVGSLLVGIQGLPFLVDAGRHLLFTNERQERLMSLAEGLTDPATDRVYDATGLVASRKSIGPQWLLHTMFLDAYASGRLPPVREMLKSHPACVLIPNYRFGWLQGEDLAFIRAHYLPLAKDFWVLGQRVREQDPTFACLHPGRYRIEGRPLGAGAAAEPVRLDGVPISLPCVRELPQGPRTFQMGTAMEVVVIWVGPHLEAVPEPGDGDPGTLFVNWY